MSEPSFDALEELRTMLAERQVMLGDTREVDGGPWVLMSPELMMQLIRDSELAEPLKAENERLRVCGTCLECSSGDLCVCCVSRDDDDVVDIHDPCHITPSRWTPYWKDES